MPTTSLPCNSAGQHCAWIEVGLSNLATQRATAAGYAWRSLGENIAAGQTSPDQAVGDWMSSSGHKANILGNYENVGFGFGQAHGKWWWTAVFGSDN